MKKIIIAVSLVVVIACGNSSNNGRRDFRYDFETGTYTLTQVFANEVDLGTTASTYQMDFSIDRDTDQIILLEAVSLYDSANALIDIDTNNYNDTSVRTYSSWNQPFDRCDTMTPAGELNCYDDRRAYTVRYLITRTNTTFSSDFNAYVTRPIPNVDYTTPGAGLYTVVGATGIPAECRPRGEVSYDNTNFAVHINFRGAGCSLADIRTPSDNAITMPGTFTNTTTVDLTISGYTFTLKKFSDTAANAAIFNFR